MSRHRHYYYDPKMIRDTLNAAVEKANEVQAKEYELIQLLRIIDEHRYYVPCGYNSLRGYCQQSLRFT